MRWVGVSWLRNRSNQAKNNEVIGSFQCRVEALRDASRPSLVVFYHSFTSSVFALLGFRTVGVEGNHVHTIAIEPQLAPGAVHVPKGQSGSKMHRVVAVCYCMAVALANSYHLRVAVCMHVV